MQIKASLQTGILKNKKPKKEIQKIIFIQKQLTA
jgi:hypothetical protein